MDINEAQTIIQQEAAKLTAAFRAKGYEKSRVEIWVGRGKDGLTIFIDERPAEFGRFLYGGDLAALLTETHKRIDEMPDRHAADAWFDPAHPMNQPVEAAPAIEPAPATEDNVRRWLYAMRDGGRKAMSSDQLRILARMELVSSDWNHITNDGFDFCAGYGVEVAMARLGATAQAAE